MRLSIVYRADCPCVAAARANVEAALALLGKAHMQIQMIPLEFEEDARLQSMHGSPTVLVDGRDPFAPADAETTLACRPEGAPSIRQLLDALRA